MNNDTINAINWRNDIRAYLVQRLALNITQWKLFEKKRITHVARFPNIVAALFIFDNLLKMLKKKKKEEKKVLLNNLQDNLYCN